MEIYGLVIIMLIMTVIMAVIIYHNRDGKTANIIFLGFLIRICATIIGYFQIVPLLGHAGGDAIMFDLIANYNYTHNSFYLKQTNYTDVLTIIYFLTDGSRIFAQFLNVLLATGTLIITSNILHKLNVPQKTTNNMLMILAFMPILICFSGALLRESWIEFFITLSLYYFVDWFIDGSISKMVYSVFAVFAASYMHAGSIFILAGFFLAFTSYKPSAKKIKLSTSTIAACFFILLVIILFLANLDSLGGKFTNMEDESVGGTIVSGYEANRGDSAYLTWLNVDNPIIGFLFSPLRMFYFLFSPIPFDWRGITDIIAFTMDSSVYAYLCWKIFKYRKNRNGKTNIALRKFLVISISALTFAFAFGTGNSGTAMRHRAKFTTILIVAYSLYRKPVYIKRNKVSTAQT